MRLEKLVLILTVLTAASLSACGQQTDASSSTSAIGATRTIVATAHHAAVHRAGSRRAQGETNQSSPARPKPGLSSRRGMLAVSSASASVVQPQPAPDSCHATGSGLYSEPDPRCTPGSLNPEVTAQTIDQTICRSGWTQTVRPDESITEQEKPASIVAYGDTGSERGYEYDHLVSLELGGATNDSRNLWPEPGASPNPKDKVEDYLNREVCDGKMTLSRAQRLIVTNWVKLSREITKPRPTKPPPPAPSAYCTASAQWNRTYDDWDVYVHSNQPDTDATVTGDGKTASYYTNGSGYADVYFYASESAAGDRVTVTVGPATCHTTL